MTKKPIITIGILMALSYLAGRMGESWKFFIFTIPLAILWSVYVLHDDIKFK